MPSIAYYFRRRDKDEFMPGPQVKEVMIDKNDMPPKIPLSVAFPAREHKRAKMMRVNEQHPR